MMDSQRLPHPNQRVLLDKKMIKLGIKCLAQKICKLRDEWIAQNSNTKIAIVGILTGVTWFYSDLTRALGDDFEFSTGFIEFHGNENDGVSFISPIQKEKYAGKKIILLDELFNNGFCLNEVKLNLLEHGMNPQDIITCVFMKKDKPTKYPKPDLFQFLLPDVWLVGYGIDCYQGFRQWNQVVAYPKCGNVTPTEDDRIFADAAFYQSWLLFLKEEVFA